MALDLFLDAFYERMDQGSRSGHRFILNRHGAATSIDPTKALELGPPDQSRHSALPPLVAPPLTLCGRDV